MEQEVAYVLNVDKTQPGIIDRFDKHDPRDHVEDNYERAQEARQLAEKCEAGRKEAAGIAGFWTKNKWKIILGALGVFAGLCGLTTVLKGLKFCKQPDTKPKPPKNPPCKSKKCKPKPPSCKGSKCHHPEPPVVVDPPVVVPEEQYGSFGDRPSASDKRTNSGNGSFENRDQGSTPTAPTNNGSFTGRGESVRKRPPTGTSTFESRPTETQNEGVGSFGERGNSEVSR